jgi:hypothetical protein
LVRYLAKLLCQCRRNIPAKIVRTAGIEFLKLSVPVPILAQDAAIPLVGMLMPDK